MVWITRSDEDAPILAEIEKQSDRGAALIATAYLEERLVAAIKSRIVRDDTIEKEMFRNSGPLGSFSSRIDIAYFVGIFGPAIRKMLHSIREIRNEFAHKADPRDFNSQRIRDLCTNISIDASFDALNKTTGLQIKFELKPDGTMRTAFLNAIKYLLFLLDMETKKLPLRVPHAPIFPDPPHGLPSGNKP